MNAKFIEKCRFVPEKYPENTKSTYQIVIRGKKRLQLVEKSKKIQL